MTGKTLLPEFGGAAGVWTTSMLFFQVMLLAGYLYAHLLTTRLAGRAQILLHSGLLLASLLVFLGGVPSPRAHTPGGEPISGILLLLIRTVGLPYFLLATTSPLLQAWFSGAGVPYRLFAISNAASLAGLLAYPFLIEPSMSVDMQWKAWGVGYAVFALLATAASRFAAAQRRPPLETDWREAALWTSLAAVPCALWLAVAHHMSQNMAPLPLLWVVPLSLYLISFIVTFESDRWYSPLLFRWLMPLAFAALLLGVRFRGWSHGIVLPMVAICAGLFLCCVFCHGELAQRRPGAGQLTGFYVVVAFGGALGGLLVSVVAPLLFRDFWELPLITVACFLLALHCLAGLNSWRVYLRLALVGTAAFVFATRFESSGSVKERNFYGVLEVREGGDGAGRWRGMLHGGILHGSQFLAAPLRRVATTYYGDQTGVAMELSRPSPGPRRIGAVGLGIGVIATYLRPGDHLRFYEINPQVVDMARKYFTFLEDARGTVEIAIGDARLTMQAEPAQNYDILIVDAFSGDAIPTHLLTREAFQLYLRHLKPGGVLAVHVTNRFLRLSPQVMDAAGSLGRKATLVRSGADPQRRIEAANWVVIKGDAAVVARRVWTDQFSDLLSALR